MPELPEVETMRCGILPILGCRIDDVRRRASQLRPIAISPRFGGFRRKVVARRIDSVDRIGKRVVLLIDSGDRIVIEPRMTGRLLLADPPNRSHVRLVFHLQGGAAEQLIFWDVRGLGVVQLLTPAEFEDRLGPQRIGADALRITADQLRTRLAGSRRAIKVALLDQQVVAGIGNIYASEILHRARIHPAMACNVLRHGQWKRLVRVIGEVLEEAISCQGSTLSDGNYRTPSDQAGGYQMHHQVYQRTGQMCLRCRKKPIVRLVQVQRSTFFCPVCQPLNR